MGMLLHGIFASNALDSTSEILDIKGLDVSSLAVANYEHESKMPGQVCGKVLRSVKIFKQEDCENNEQLMFWNRIKIPFLYGIIELFDDVGHSGAMDVAAMALYDQKNKNKYDYRKTFPLIGFSIEGSKINKEQNVITHSLARRVSLTITPANKTCWGEVYEEPEQQAKPINKKESVTKTKELLSKILKSEEISSEQELLIKHDIEDLEVLEKSVHSPTAMYGVSEMGIEARRGDIKKPGVIAHGYGRVTKPEVHLGRAKAMAQKQLQSIRQEPKPSLPKSEESIEKGINDISDPAFGLLRIPSITESSYKAPSKVDLKIWTEDSPDFKYESKYAQTPTKGSIKSKNNGKGIRSSSSSGRSHYHDKDQIIAAIPHLSNGKKVTVESRGFGRRMTYSPEHLPEIQAALATAKPSLPKSEELIGGKGDNKPLSSFDSKEVKMGRVVEKEHTKSPKISQEITADHLAENSHYYSKLKSAGLADELEKTNQSVWSSRRAAQPIQKKEESKPQWSSRRAVNSMQKALTATASPLNPEILEPKMQTITKSLELKKSESVDASIPTWGLVEKFKDFLQERVPSLTSKEADAFTRAFKIFKIKAAEKKLKDL